MFKIKLMPTVAVVVGLLAASASGEYYYSGGRQIPLKVDSLKVTIKFDVALPDSLQDSLLATIDRIAQVVEDIHLSCDLVKKILDKEHSTLIFGKRAHSL